MSKTLIGLVVAILTAPLALAHQAPVIWTDVTGVVASGVGGTTLTKTAPQGWNGVAISVQTLGGGDGYVEFETLETNRLKVAGLGWPSISGSFEDIDFAFRGLTD